MKLWLDQPMSLKKNHKHNSTCLFAHDIPWSSLSPGWSLPPKETPGSQGSSLVLFSHVGGRFLRDNSRQIWIFGSFWKGTFSQSGLILEWVLWHTEWSYWQLRVIDTIPINHHHSSSSSSSQIKIYHNLFYKHIEMFILLVMSVAIFRHPNVSSGGFRIGALWMSHQRKGFDSWTEPNKPTIGWDGTKELLCLKLSRELARKDWKSRGILEWCTLGLYFLYDLFWQFSNNCGFSKR